MEKIYLVYCEFYCDLYVENIYKNEKDAQAHVNRNNNKYGMGGWYYEEEEVY